MDKKKIYILLTYSGSLLSKAIKMYTKEPYSHVSLSLDEDLNQLYSFGRKRPRNPLYAGFVREDVIEGTYAYFPKTRCAFYSLDVDEETYKMIKEEIKAFESRKDIYGYNFLGLIGFMLNKPIDRNNKYFCSQFVSELLSNSGINIIDKPAALTQPRDFRTCNDLELVYEGELNKYKSLEFF